MLSRDWPTNSRQSESKPAKPRLSVLPRTPKKKGNGSDLKMRSKGKHRNRRSEILRRLDVDEDALAAQTQIMPRLRRTGVKLEYFLEILRCDYNPQSATFLQAWDQLTSAAQRLVGIEAVGVSIGLLPRDLWALFSGAELVQSNEDTAVMVSIAVPGAMKQTIKGAMKAKGIADREHLYKIARVLPTPKGATTNINLGGKKESEELTEGDDTKGDLEPCDAQVLSFAKVMNPQKELVAHRALDEVEELPEVEE
jgi:hypothetical protein